MSIRKKHELENEPPELLQWSTEDLKKYGVTSPMGLFLRIVGHYIDKRLEILERRLIKRYGVCDKRRIH